MKAIAADLLQVYIASVPFEPASQADVVQSTLEGAGCDIRQVRRHYF
jgi:hypothetical protein